MVPNSFQVNPAFLFSIHKTVKSDNNELIWSFHNFYNFRYATTQAQFCTALLAMIRLKRLRSSLARKKKVDYVLVFAGDGEVMNEEEVIVDNPVVERLVQRWIDEGGILGGFNVDKKNPIRFNRK